MYLCVDEEVRWRVGLKVQPVTVRKDNNCCQHHVTLGVTVKVDGVQACLKTPENKRVQPTFSPFHCYSCWTH